MALTFVLMGHELKTSRSFRNRVFWLLLAISSNEKTKKTAAWDATRGVTIVPVGNKGRLLTGQRLMKCKFSEEQNPCV